MKKTIILNFLLCIFMQVAADTWTDSNGRVWRFSVSGTNAINVKPYTTDDISGDVVIPEKIYSYTVTSIDNYAFRSCHEMTSVVIPSNVTDIGRYVFYNCDGLTSIIIPSKVKTIGEGCFNGCINLVKVTINSDAIVYKSYSVNSTIKKIFGEQVKQYIIGNNVTGIGTYAFYNCSNLTNIIIPNSVKTISSSAFSGCSGLTSVHISDVAAWCNIHFNDISSNPLNYAHHLYLNGEEVKDLVIPNSVKSIGYSAFSGCSGLTSVTIPNSVTSIYNYAFRYCSGLTSVTIGNSVTSIGKEAFIGCSGLTSVHISDVAAWCNIPFNDNSSNPLYYAHHLYMNGEEVIDLTIPNNVTSIGEKAFLGCSGLTSVTIPNSVTSIGNSAFSSCSGLTSVTIPNRVTSISKSVFNGCINLVKVTINSDAIVSKSYSVNSTIKDIFGEQVEQYIIGDNVTGIGYLAFYNCSNLTNIIISNSVTSISSSAFNGCSGLTSVTIPNSVTSIGHGAFSGCTGLTSIKVEEGNTFYDSRNNCNAIISTAENELLSGCKNTDIPYSVKSIGDWAFEGCSGLTSVTIPNSVTSIGYFAFKDCTGLISVTIPNSVTFIDSNAFRRCSGLISVTIHSVSSIGDWAFADCNNLIFVTIKNRTPINISDHVFTNRSNATLYVPAGCKASYESAEYWNQFKEIKEEVMEQVVLGDLNDDGSVSITDIVLIIDVIAGAITDAKKVEAADVNKDGSVTITDCVAAIDLIAAQTNGVRMNRTSAMPVCTDFISAFLQGNLLTVNLDNENRYTAFQMVVTMPEGMTLDKAVMDELRGTDHQLTVRNLGNGQYLLAGFSMDNSELAGNSGCLLTIATNGQTKGDIVISDIEFTTAEAEAYHLAPISISSTATGFYQIEGREWKQDDVIFDLQGRRVNQPSRGLYIVNGSKLIVK